MDVERRTFHERIDSRDDRMIYQGIIYRVTVDQRDSQTWCMEVLEASERTLAPGAVLFGHSGAT
jgi:hypothetical protein